MRLHNIDQLRGVLACIVMLYHYVCWSDNLYLPTFVERPLYLMGLYGVSLFYVISGIALYVVYHQSEFNLNFLREFFLKRMFRIIPLFWLATTIALTLQGAEFIISYREKILLSYSMLFSVFRPSAYFTTGAWSIGNEWAFYIFFPIFIWRLKHTNWSIYIYLITTLFCIYFSFFEMNAQETVSQQWNKYISPLNQLPLFVGGLFIGKIIVGPNLQKIKNHTVLLIGSFITLALLFGAISLNFSTSACISGWLRILLILICIICCLNLCLLPSNNSFIGKTLQWLGIISYSVYLLHPFSYKFVIWLNIEGQILILVTSIGITLIISHLSYHFFEKVFVNVGKNILKKKS